MQTQTNTNISVTSLEEFALTNTKTKSNTHEHKHNQIVTSLEEFALLGNTNTITSANTNTNTKSSAKTNTHKHKHKCHLSWRVCPPWQQQHQHLLLHQQQLPLLLQPSLNHFHSVLKKSQLSGFLLPHSQNFPTSPPLRSLCILNLRLVYLWPPPSFPLKLDFSSLSFWKYVSLLKNWGETNIWDNSWRAAGKWIIAMNSSKYQLSKLFKALLTRIF